MLLSALIVLWLGTVALMFMVAVYDYNFGP
jgi:hypothetical protein